MNKTKSHSKYDDLFRKLHNDEEQYVRLLLRTGVRGLSEGICQTKFVSLFDMKIHFSEGKGDRFSKGEQHTHTKNSLHTMIQIFQT